MAFNISDYLNKFKKLSESRGFLRNTISEAIKEVCEIEIKPEDIDVKSGIARINAKPIVKSEIFLKKAKILELLKGKTESKIIEIL